MPARAHPVAMVTGGANGIGRAIVRHLTGNGWRVGVLDLPGSGLHRAFPRGTRHVTLIEGDVGIEETAPRAVAAIFERFGRLDALVSNAGIMIRKPLRRLTLPEWHRVLDTNLTATFLLARAAEKPLRKAHFKGKKVLQVERIQVICFVDDGASHDLVVSSKLLRLPKFMIQKSISTDEARPPGLK
jgi:NAD(P)-dependent dehydrogenase (short-subunit alcohol dehydrogenase family)